MRAILVPPLSLPGLLLIALVVGAPALAQEMAVPDLTGETAAPSSNERVIAEIEASRAAAEGDPTLVGDVKGRVLELLNRAIDERRRAAELITETATLRARIEQAPARIELLRGQLAVPATKPDPVLYSATPLDELTSRSREKQQQLDAARTALTDREKRLASLAALGSTLSDEITSQRQALRGLAQESGSAPRDGFPAAASARQAWQAARQARLSAESEKAELQLANYDLLVRLATLERDLIAQQVPRLDAEREALARALESRRAEQARAALEEAQADEAKAASLPAAVARLATDNAALRKELEKITAESSRVAERLRATERRESGLESNLTALRERFETVGHTEAIGRLLRRSLMSLRALEADGLRASGVTDEIVDATDRRIDLGEQRRELAATRATVDPIIASVLQAQREAFEEQALRERTTALAEAKRATVEELYEAYSRYLTQLTSLDAMQRRLADTADAMREFIRRELLWTRSLPAVSPADLAGATAGLMPLFEPANWINAAADARAGVARNPGGATLALLAVLALLALRPLARRRLVTLGDLASRIRTDAFRHTAVALGLTVLIAVTWPAFFGFAAWLLRASEHAAPFTLTLSATLEQLAGLLIIFTTARWIIDDEGLARRHFGWPEPVRATLRREFRWLTVVGLVCVVIGVYGAAQGTLEARLSQGRPALMLFAAALAIFFWRVFRRGGSLMQHAASEHPDSTGVRLWRLWFPLLVGVPVATVLAAAIGYFDAARTATALIIDSGFLLLGVWVLRDTMMRWFTVSERRMRFDQLLQQREEARAERAARAQGQDEIGEYADVAEVEVPQVDFRELGAQGRALVQGVVLVGVALTLAAIWSDLLPALTVFDRIQLPMSRVTLVDGVEQRVAVTVTDVALALAVLGATLFAAKNLSGLLGFTVLRRVAGDAGAQYAIVTLCQYALVAVGLLYAFSEVGVEWSKLQWLVAALGVGLGFGLQEIVANFVSGIILLLERPVRVGDVVTVGDATGTVARIRIRATTLVDFDRKELVVPNKEFVTGRLLNWTLSNDTLRLVVPVGIAYGSDPRRARELLLEAAREDEHVLHDPAPIVLFNQFGDNALGLELRVYLPSIEHLLKVQTALHDAIYEKFAQAGIVIAFPQRDLHLDTSAPLDVRLHAADGADGTDGTWRPRWRFGLDRRARR